MLSKAVIKYINSLQIKKYRNLHQAFVVEGAKSVRELLASDLEVEKLFLTEDFCRKHPEALRKGLPYELVTEKELVQAGTYESNNAGLAIAKTQASGFKGKRKRIGNCPGRYPRSGKFGHHHPHCRLVRHKTDCVFRNLRRFL